MTTPTAKGPQTTVNQYLPERQESPGVIALSDGGYFVYWEGQQASTGGSWEIVGRFYNANGTARSNEFIVNSITHVHQWTASATELSNGNIAATWYNHNGGGTASVKIINSSGSTVVNEFTVSGVSSVNNVSVAAQDGGGFVVTVQAGNNVVAQRYTDAGVANGSLITVAANVNGGPVETDALAGGGWVTAYSVNNAATIRIFASDGTGGSPITVDSAGITAADTPGDVTVLSDGRFVVSWSGTPSGSSSSEVYAQVFQANGTPVGAAFQVNTSTSGAQSSTQGAALADGGFIITWTSDGQDGSSNGVYGQRFDSSGNAVGNEFRVNDATTNSQQNAYIGKDGVAVLDDGTVVAVYTDGSAGNNNVASRAFTAGPLTPAPTADADDLTGTAGDDTIDLLAGDDTYSGGEGNDTITGGAGRDTLNGDAGDDTFIVNQGDLVAGEVYNGGADTDTLELRGGGAFDLTTVTVVNVENVTTDGNDTTLTVANQTQALLVSNMGGQNDTLIINAWATTNGNAVLGDLITLLGGRGVETVEWSKNGFDFSAVLNGGTGRVEITTADANNARSFDTIVNAFDAIALRKQVKTDDDGAVTTTNFDANGVITDVTIDATGAGRSFDTLEQTYTDGKLASSTLETSEITVEKTYETSGPASVIVTNVRTDKAGGTEYSWDTITETYDAAGNLTQRMTVNDVGQNIVSTEINFAGGVMTDRTITFADGRIQETLFSGGVVELTRTTAKGTQTVAGGAGDNTIAGGAANDLLIGGLGNDVFEFSGAFGNDRISDFGRGLDRLDLRAYGIDSRDDFTNNANGYTATQVGRNVVIDLGQDGTITLTNFQLANLDDNDFVV